MVIDEVCSHKWSNMPDDEWNYNLRCGKCDLVKRISHSDKETDLYIEAKSLPSWLDLNKIVTDLEKNSSWWDVYGLEWSSFAFSIPLFISGVIFTGNSSVIVRLIGIFLAACCHMLWVDRMGHLALHNAMCKSKIGNRIILFLTQDFISGFSPDLGLQDHIQNHHPFTNIIGLGDSSTWRAPFLPKEIYLYIAPLILPILTPIISVLELMKLHWYISVMRLIICFSTGAYLFTSFTSYMSGLDFYTSLWVVFLYRSLMMIPFVHMNIFQHIGLPMWTVDNKPARVYQMTASCINIHGNILMDFVFGATLLSCHIEHHLFPRLSDSMCLKIKPYVKEFVKKSGLPYNETSYFERLATFHKRYSELMVEAPPITHFIGIQ